MKLKENIKTIAKDKDKAKKVINTVLSPSVLTILTSVLILWQIVITNKQNSFENDYEIYKDSFDRIEIYFNDITLDYKQDNYMTYFYYLSKIDKYFTNKSVFYLDSKKEYLQDEQDFKKAIMKSHTLLAYLDYIVGHFHYYLKRITPENLKLILEPISNYIFLHKDKISEENKNYGVSFLFYTFWCYDDKEGRTKFSYPNLLTYFKESKKDSSDFWKPKEIKKNGVLTNFIEDSFYFLECIFPNEDDKDFIKDQKKILTRDLENYFNKASVDNPNFLYFRFFLIEWSEILHIFMIKLNEVRNIEPFKSIFDRQTKIDGVIYNYSNVKLKDDDKKTIKNLSFEDKLILTNYYEQYHNFTQAIELYKNLTKNTYQDLTSKTSYEKVLVNFTAEFANKYADRKSFNYRNDTSVREMFNPISSPYFIMLSTEHDLIIKIIEDYKISREMKEKAKLEEKLATPPN